VRRFAVAAAILCAACSASGPGGTLRISWRFADGRDCDNAGADRVELRLQPLMPDDDPEGMFDCPLGLAPQSVVTPTLPSDGTLYLDARSLPGSDLYRGTLTLDAARFIDAGDLTITLFAEAAN
jgi:hypothetical protein